MVQRSVARPRRQLAKVQPRRLTAGEYQQLAMVPPEAEWFANLRNPGTRRIYQADIANFMSFVGIERAEEFRTVRRAHVVAVQGRGQREGGRARDPRSDPAGIPQQARRFGSRLT